MTSKNRLFSNASEYDCWIYQNCAQCSKAGKVSLPGSSSCEIIEAIHDAALGIDIPGEVAMRFGEVEEGDFLIFRDCPEKVSPKGQAASGIVPQPEIQP